MSSKIASKKVSKAEPVTSRKLEPEKTKKAPSSFIIFSNEKRPKVKVDNPEATFGELCKILGEQWRNLTEVEKQVKPKY